MELEVMFLLCTIVITIIFLKLLVRLTTSVTKKITNQPPSPPRFPVIGNLHQLGRHPHRSLRSLSDRYGPLMLLRFGRVPILVVSSADAAHDFFKTHDLVSASRPKLKFVEKLMYDGRGVAFGPYGEYWKQIKSVCVLQVLSNSMVRSFQNVREEMLNLMTEKLEKASSSSSSVNLTELFMSVSNNLICRIALGRKYSVDEEGAKNMGVLLKKLAKLLIGFNVEDYIPWLAWIDRVRGLDNEMKKLHDAFDDFLERVVQQHLDADHHEKLDFVDVLLSIQRENTVGFEMDKTSIKAIILDVISGGTYPNYTVLEWAMTELFIHPESMNKLKDEVRSIAKHKSYVSEEDVQNMKYLKAVVRETLRVHPPVPLLPLRLLTQDIKLKEYEIAAGTQVLVNVWAITRETSTWGSDAEEFRPERHLDSSVDFRGQDFQFIPFGVGRRICPGIGFASVIVELVLANLVHRFDWREASLEPTRETCHIPETTGIVVNRKFPLIAFPSSTLPGF